jgi:ATP-dependent RNA helicase DeaD
MAQISIGAGGEADVQLKDLVGAITGEPGIAGREVSAIEIADLFSVIEIAEDVAENALGELRRAISKGRKVKVHAELER